MLQKLSVRNYRSLVDLDIDLDGPHHLLMGRNGSGKSSVLEILSGVRALLVDGVDCDTLFPLLTTPRWMAPDENESIIQNIIVAANGHLGTMTYNLSIVLFFDTKFSGVFRESLCDDEGLLYSTKAGTVQLYNDKHETGSSYKVDTRFSAMAPIPSDDTNKKMTWFKEQIAGLHCLRIDAPRMNGRSEREEIVPARDMSNFASWYRHVLLADSAAGAAFHEALSKAMPGFVSLNLRPLGQGYYSLEVRFRSSMAGSDLESGKQYVLQFNELSDGQRALIALHAINHFLVRENTTVCIDEPDNYIGLRELQPVMYDLLDQAEDRGSQLIVASHHPELLNMMALREGVLFERDGTGATTTRPFSASESTSLTPAEYFARGLD